MSPARRGVGLVAAPLALATARPAARRAPAALAAILALGVTLPAARPAGAARFSGHATTIVRFFDLVQDLAGAEKVVEYRPVDQYLRLSWNELGRSDAWSVDALIRGHVELGSDTAFSGDALQVLHAEAGWRSPDGGLDLTLGRIRSVTGLGWRAFDGMRLDVRELRRARFFVSAGLPVELAENDEPDTDGFTWAAGATWIVPRHGSLGVSYELRRLEDRTHEETASLDAHLRGGGFSFSANANYSVLHDRFADSAIVVRHAIRGRHVAEARWTRVDPVFPPDTIFAVFDVNEFTETRLSYEFRGRGGVSVGAYVAREDYVDTERPGPQDIDRAAAVVRLEGPRDARHRAELGWQSGFSGDELSARYDVDLNVTRRLRLGGGLSWNRYENAYRLDESDQQAALRARASWDQHGRWEVGLQFEQYLGRNRDTLRGQLVFKAKLGAARAERPWWGGHWAGAWAGGTPTRAGTGDGESPEPSDPEASPSEAESAR